MNYMYLRAVMRRGFFPTGETMSIEDSLLLIKAAEGIIFLPSTLPKIENKEEKTMEKPSSERVLKITSAILGNLCILREYMDVMDMSELTYFQRCQVEQLKKIIPVLPPRIGLAYLPVYAEYVCRQLESIIDEEDKED